MSKKVDRKEQICSLPETEKGKISFTNWTKNHTIMNNLYKWI